MTTRHIELDVSGDVVDKVLFFLESLPKNKVKLRLNTPAKKEIDNDVFSQTAGILSSRNIDPLKWQEQIRSEWNE